MSYTSGVANSVADLVTAINNAAVADGWTLATGILSKGTVNTRVTAQSSSLLKVEGANDTAFTQACPWFGNVVLVAFPVAYRIFTASSPDCVFVHIREANLVAYQYVMFGAIQNKVGTWTGGNFFSASRNTRTVSMTVKSTFNQLITYMGQYGVHGAPFAGGNSAYSYEPSGDGMYCDFNGGTWVDGSKDAASYNHAYWPSATYPVAAYTPNLWNSQAVLFHPHLYMPVGAGRFSRIGTLPHIRLLRITNYETYDIITLGADRWMVMPWVQKNSTYPDSAVNGAAALEGHSGTWGVAVRYDGP